MDLQMAILEELKRIESEWSREVIEKVKRIKER